MKRVGCRLMIEDKNRTVAELLETAKEKLRSLIQYLCALDVTQSEDGVFFASRAKEGGSPKVCAVLSMRSEILECELPQNYAWDFTPWEELMGYGLAETKLTKDHANTVLAQILVKSPLLWYNQAVMVCNRRKSMWNPSRPRA